MIIGEHSRDTDLDVSWFDFLLFILKNLNAMSSLALTLQVNPVRSKELTNIRSAGKDENVKLSPPRLVCILFCFHNI